MLVPQKKKKKNEEDADFCWMRKKGSRNRNGRICFFSISPLWYHSAFFLPFFLFYLCVCVQKFYVTPSSSLIWVLRRRRPSSPLYCLHNGIDNSHSVRSFAIMLYYFIWYMHTVTNRRGREREKNHQRLCVCIYIYMQ